MIWVAIAIAGGFLGAYTTFSTAMYETVRLWEDGARRAAAAANLLAPLLLATAAAMLGWWVAS